MFTPHAVPNNIASVDLGSDGFHMIVARVVDNDRLALKFSPHWLETHPLPLVELEQEAERLTPAGFQLAFQ